MVADVHLVVLVHGMWGNIHHFAYTCSELAARGAVIHDGGVFDGDTLQNNKETLVVYRPRSNQGYFTYDGIDVCGMRISNDIEAEIAAIEAVGGRVVRMSLAGYSMGGLIVRYAAGILYTRGTLDTIELETLTTLFSPHVGTNMLGTRLSQRLFNFIGSWAMARTSRQVFLRDAYVKSGTPLFKHLTDPGTPYAIAANRFKRRALYANIAHDRRCDWYTSAVTDSDPWVQRDRLNQLVGPFSSKYGPVVIDGISPKFGTEASPKRSVPSWKENCVLSMLWRIIRITGVVGRVAIVLPIWFTAFLINAAYQTVASELRTRTLVKDGSHIPQYDFADVLEDRADSLVEDMYQTVSDPSTLRITPIMRQIIDQFNSQGWEKYPVHITANSNAHAAAIVRNPNNKSMYEGKLVIAHWLDTVLGIPLTTHSTASKR